MANSEQEKDNSISALCSFCRRFLVLFPVVGTGGGPVLGPSTGPANRGNEGERPMVGTDLQ